MVAKGNTSICTKQIGEFIPNNKVATAAISSTSGAVLEVLKSLLSLVYDKNETGIIVPSAIRLW